MKSCLRSYGRTSSRLSSGTRSNFEDVKRGIRRQGAGEKRFYYSSIHQLLCRALRGQVGAAVLIRNEANVRISRRIEFATYVAAHTFSIQVRSRQALLRLPTVGAGH